MLFSFPFFKNFYNEKRDIPKASSSANATAIRFHNYAIPLFYTHITNLLYAAFATLLMKSVLSFGHAVNSFLANQRRP